MPVVTPPVPPVPPTPPVSAPVSGAGKVLKGAEKIGVGIISTIIPKKKEKTKKEPPPALQKSTTVQIETKPKIEKSTDTKNGTNVPFQPVVIPLFSEGSGPKIAVFDFEGEHGVEIADYISEALTKNFRVYDRKSLSGKGLAKEKVNNATLKKIKKDVDADYFVTGGVSKKTETLYIVSVFLKDGKKGDTKMTDYPKFKKLDELKSTAEIIAGKIKKRVGELK
ncbi:MAG: hypothetical protein HY919_07445 [Elusimicrobia bacterium]|nr:hypothetical protein [Elusimicrobiota bacterium]